MEEEEIKEDVASSFDKDAAATNTSQSPQDVDSHTLHTPIKIHLTPDKSEKVTESKEPPSKTKGSPKLNVNDKLKETLEKHGIARQNADSFLLGLLKNREFKNLVKTTNLDDEDSSDEDVTSAPAAPMTRAKLKEAMMNSPFKLPLDEKSKVTPKFTEIPLPEDDDDEEYQPVEESFGSDTRDRSLMDEEPVHMDLPEEGRENTEERPVCDHTEHLEEPLPLQVDESFTNNAEGGDDIISKRTRSKHSLQSTSLDVLEAAFDPPDATPDMYDNSSIGDYDWHQWLSDLMKDDGGKGNGTEEEDNPDEDPDFNFTPELDKPDAEDMRDDHSVQVSKKELYGLLDEIENMQKNDWPPVTIIKNPPSDISARSSSPKKQMKMKLAQRKRSNDRLVQPHIPLLQMAQPQVELLNQQLQQHVQLLAQVNILCRNVPDLEDCVAESKELLLELQKIAQNQINILNIPSSHVMPWCLKEAINLTAIHVPPSGPIVRLLGKEVSKGHESITKSVAEVLANSNVFMYRELLPLSGPSSKGSGLKIPFRPAEDCLVALGLAEMDGMENNFELISQHMLPTKTEKQIQVRIRNVLSCRNLKDSVNPIRNYHVCQSLPKRRTDIKYIYKDTAKKPLDMKGSLPCWVLALKPVYVPEESSDDSVSEFGPAMHSTPYDNSNAIYSQNAGQQAVGSPLKAVMVPFSIVHAVPVSLPLVQTISGVKVSLAKPSSMNSQSATTAAITSTMNTSGSNLPSLTTAVVPTSITTKPISSSKIQSSPKYGRGRSGGKSMKRLSESTVISLSSSSSSSSEDEPEMEEKMDTSTPPKGDTTPSDVEENLQAGSDDEEQTDQESEENPKSRTMNSSPSTAAPNTKEEDDPKFIPLGGYLQKMHPKITGKKGKPGSRDLRRARSTAKMVKSLEEDTIMQLDPKRIEKEKLFAAGYLERVEKCLKNNPAIHKQFLETLVKYSDGTKSPVDLYVELSTLLKDWPDLLQGFAPFLMPEQARECGLNTEQEVYARARKFLRQLEIQFGNNPGHMEKILNVFHNVAETAIYREEEMMKSILTLLKDHPYLQDEFLTFFDEQHPPKILFDEDFEEVDLTDELMKDPSLNQYEFVNLPLEVPEPDSLPPQDSIVKRPRKRKISLGSRDECKSPVKSASLNENKENISPELVNSDVEDDGEETGNTDYESEDALIEDVPEDLETDKPSSSVPPDLAVISEDALSSSPFKRITEEAAQKPIVEPLRPDTPTGMRLDSTTSATLGTSPLPLLKPSSEEMPGIPATPGKVQPMNDGNHSGSEVPGTDRIVSDPSCSPVNNGDADMDVNNDVVPKLQDMDTAPTVAACKSASLSDEEHSPASQSGAGSPLASVQQTSEPDPEGGQRVVEGDALSHAVDDVPSSSTTQDTDVGWTRQTDEVILTACQKGISPSMFAEVAEKLQRTAAEVENRLSQLLKFFNGSETDDPVSQESEEDGDIYSDSSAA